MTILAHGGERGDLPLPLYLLGWGIGLILVLSLLSFGTLWPQPRLGRAAAGRPLIPHRALSVMHVVARVVAFAIYLACLYAGFFGFDVVDRNLLPVTLYVTVWIGGQLVAGLLGDLWAVINPIDTLARGAEAVARAAGREPGGGPTTWGHWPATVGVLIFLFYELAHPSGRSPRTLAWAVGVHALLTVAAGVLWGARWVRDHEPFTVLFATIGAMGPLYDRRSGDVDGDRGADDRSLGFRAPLAGLAALPIRSGTTVLLLVAIGSTAFDGFSASDAGVELFRDLSDWSGAMARTGLMIVAIAAAATLYYAAVLWIARSTAMPFDQAWNEFAPALVPIAFGYAAVHYLQFFYNQVQAFVFRLSDPLGQGWDLFGGTDGLISPIDPNVGIWFQLTIILLAHLGAVIVAHDRAVERFPPGRSLQSQLVMLLVTVGYSALGLWLLLTA